MPIYMRIEGIQGSATLGSEKGLIELESAQLGGQRRVTTPTGRGVNREAASPSVSEIVVTKRQDDASSGLFRLAMWGEGKKVTIYFVKTVHDDTGPEVYLKIELENVVISGYSISGHGGTSHTTPMESLSLNFTKITYVTGNQGTAQKQP